MDNKHQDTVRRMTLDEKIRFGSGASFWQTEKYPQHGIPSLFMADGPHGLRKQEGERNDNLGLAASRNATCFPPACCSGATWDEELLYRMGRAIGEEAAAIGVDVVLGPGVNMKRNPLCGRNFEYYSEDPLVAGKLAAAWIKGVQSTGAGTSLKHFCCNSQEKRRMASDSIVDERALREYYLSAFETAVREGRPYTVMSAYNKLNGAYCSDNELLLTHILREEWGFDGLVVSDWGGMNDRVAGYKAGCDLEMPGSMGRFDKEVKEAVEAGRLDESCIDHSSERLLTLIDRVHGRKTTGASMAELADGHHELARDIAMAGAVLMKNDGVLPIACGASVAVIGALARSVRYQGCGSSLVTPTRLVDMVSAVSEYAPDAVYAAGYTVNDAPDDALLAEAVSAAEKAGTAILCIGLTPAYESEGFDRSHMRLPQNQLALLDALTAASARIAVVLMTGSPVEMPWTDGVNAILNVQLGGQAVCEAASRLLFGKANPSGRLAETYPMRYEDEVTAPYYAKEGGQAAYYESMYAGYRWFDAAEMEVRFPFGFGLSYTSFDYSDMSVAVSSEQVTVRLTVKNTGAMDGVETVQLYIAPGITGGAYRPVQTLGGFARISLKAGEAEEVTVTLPLRRFAIWQNGGWTVEKGEYEIRAAASSRDVRLCETVVLPGSEPVRTENADWYYHPEGTPGRKELTGIYGEYPVCDAKTRGTYDMTSCIRDMKETSLVCRIVYGYMEKLMAKNCGGKVDYDDPQFRMYMDGAAESPMRALTLMSPKDMPVPLARFLVETANGRFFRGLGILIKGKTN